jgi:hypothetical protein
MPPKRKIAVIQAANALGLTYKRCYTRRVSFTDLARNDKEFIYFDGLSPTTADQWDSLKLAAKEQGYVLGSKGL